MSHLILELILWMLFAFFVGCIIGCLLHKLFGGGSAALETPANKVAEIPVTSAAIETPATVVARKPEPDRKSTRLNSSHRL